MEQHCGERPVVAAHHPVTLFQRLFPPFLADASFHEVGEDKPAVVDKVRLFQAADTPFVIGNKAILGVVHRSDGTLCDERLVAYAHPAPETSPGECPRGTQPPGTYRISSFVYNHRLTVNHVRHSFFPRNVLCKVLHQIRRIECVAGIDKPNVVARCMLQPFVHGIVQPVVRFARPVRQPGGKLFDDFPGPVGGVSIDNDVFDVRIRLAQYAEDCLFKKTLRVIGYGDD